MKVRDTLVLVIVLTAAFAPMAGMFASDDSDAADNEYTYYYRDQLTANQKLIYAALESLDPSSVAKNVYAGHLDDYVATVTVSGYTMSSSSAEALTEAVYADMARAWQATLLDDPMAWWAWSTDKAGLALYQGSFSLSSSSITGLTFYVYINESFFAESTSLSDKVAATQTAFDKLISDGTVKQGSTVVDTIRNINTYLCSPAFSYDKTGTHINNVYGAFVYKDGDVHKIVCTGYSQAFKMFCDKFGIPCVGIVGIADQKDGGGMHMWNAVKITCTINGTEGTYVLGVDTTFDATSGSTEGFLLSGYKTEVGGVAFSQVHQAFAPASTGTLSQWTDYIFTAPAINSEGYSFPAQKSILESLQDYVPWILAGMMCIILAYVLFSLGRRGNE